MYLLNIDLKLTTDANNVMLSKNQEGWIKTNGQGKVDAIKKKSHIVCCGSNFSFPFSHAGAGLPQSAMNRL